jgi:hypothetical protein
VLLRDFLYVDTDKVRGLLAQLDEGIVEASSEADTHEKSSGLGLKALAEHSQRWGSERTVQKSLGDALFPTLEQALEATGLLVDLSDSLTQGDFWGAEMREHHPPGTLVRITAPAALFDARYLADTFAQFATSLQGLVDMEILQPLPTPRPKPPGKGGQGGQRRKQPTPIEGIRQLEDAIPDVDLNFDGSVVSRSLMQGVVRLARGMFTPGLHLHMQPVGAEGFGITARLQEGRQFLDSEPDVLFARYGAGLQEWTVVGSLGHYGATVSEAVDNSGLTRADGTVDRSVFVRFINQFVSFLGTQGFVDVPAEPGFSVVPLAVYRVVAQSSLPATLDT